MCLLVYLISIAIKASNQINFFICRTPWNQETLIGYICTIFMQAFTIFSAVFLLCAVICIYFGFCSYSEGFLLDLVEDIKKIGKDVSEQRKVIEISELRKRIIGIVNFHNFILT